MSTNSHDVLLYVVIYILFILRILYTDSKIDTLYAQNYIMQPQKREREIRKHANILFVLKLMHCNSMDHLALCFGEQKTKTISKLCAILKVYLCLKQYKQWLIAFIKYFRFVVVVRLISFITAVCNSGHSCLVSNIQT